ncbi:ParB N-terminal domain-containing protein [Candidatus Bathyarchaeota archaeon]|nr:ParB N-terminal domain-containing protein [Candidatus Bathyarchaeota archaeon]
MNKTPILQWLRIEDIKIPEGRIHSYFDDYRDFEESVRDEGVIQPVHVFMDSEGNKWLADGQNRLETAKKHGKFMIQAYVMHGTKQDALLYSAKLNVLRGKVNVGELAEFLLKLRKGMKVEDIAESLRFSKGYVSKLLNIAENKSVLEKLKAGLISYKEAYNEVLSKSSEEAKSFPGKPESQETRREEKPTETMPMKREEPLTDEALGLTSSLKEALEEGKRFKPLGAEEEEEERRGRCAFCGGYFTSKSEITFIAVHKKECKRKVWDLIIKAEREARNESSQP